MVLALQSVTLESESMDGGHRDFIAVGTGFDFAEDRATRGNVSNGMDCMFRLDRISEEGRVGDGMESRRYTKRSL